MDEDPDFICPAGHYCETGSRYPVPCPLGTHNENTNSVDFNACDPCTQAATLVESCTSRGQVTPDGGSVVCSAGFYCPSKAEIYPCPSGTYCPSGSADFTACPQGEYQPDIAQEACITCPEGYICEIDTTGANAGALYGSNYAAPCAPGFFCNRGSYEYKTSGADDMRCEAGTYNPYEGARYASECLDCQEGFTCPDKGLSDLTSPTDYTCTQGLYCPAGSVTGQNCPKGSYCPAGSVEPITCPVGTFGNADNSVDVSDCQPCTDDFYCGSRGMQETEIVLCGSGFQCAGFTTSDTSESRGAMSPYPTAN